MRLRGAAWAVHSPRAAGHRVPTNGGNGNEALHRGFGEDMHLFEYLVERVGLEEDLHTDRKVLGRC